jgi:hypothetical protein
LPALIDVYEAHRGARDKFEIVAFHVGKERTFAEIDKNLDKSRQLYWFGRQLPFPVLLDATGKTADLYGVRGLPTTLLIDPEGKLVGEATEAQLEAKLPPLPMPAQIARALDGNVQYFFDDPPLTQAIETLAKESRIGIRLDAAGLKAAGVAPDARVPYKMSGIVTLRSALNLALAAYPLAVEQEDKGLVVTARKKPAAADELSGPQRFCIKRIEDALNQKVSFDFQAKTLDEVAQHFERQLMENFVLDPACRREGTLDPKGAVTASGKDVPVREALKGFLDPLGLRAVVRDEVVVITSKAKAN